MNIRLIDLLAGLGYKTLGTVLLLAALIVTGGSAVYAQANAEIDLQQDAPLRVVTKEIEPFVFVDDELSGFSIDLWQEIARRPISTSSSTPWKP